MYLHLGNNYIIKQKDLIAIYNIESIKDTAEYKSLIKELEEKHLLIKSESIEPKSLIIVKDEDKILGYFSNISSTTIAKRKDFNMQIR